EFERVYAAMKGKDSFSVTQFLEVHNDSFMFRHKKLFTHINTRRYVDAYIDKHQEEVRYNKSDKRWYFPYNPPTYIENNGEVDNPTLSF
ncbi:MAG: hypothetical protein GX857_09020, partial [Bacteroidales bacterium]|nr:hypothetical protein [Bacteroidales bacterium]